LTALVDPSYAQIVVRHSLPDRSQSMPGVNWPTRAPPGGTAVVLISDSHAFIFVHMRKVASTSMQSILRPSGACRQPIANASVQTSLARSPTQGHSDSSCCPIQFGSACPDATKFDQCQNFPSSSSYCPSKLGLPALCVNVNSLKYIFPLLTRKSART
jgi:hypothetical protein